MATRQDVETGIASIENNGNNKAEKVRGVLTTLLDYTENQDNASDLNPFSFNNKGKPVKDKSKAILLYSFKGFEEFTVNLTFKMIVGSNNRGRLSFPLEAAALPVIKEIIQTKNMFFIVPFFRKPAGVTTNFPIAVNGVGMGLSITEPNFLELNFPFPLKKDDGVFTSIQLHSPAQFKLE